MAEAAQNRTGDIAGRPLVWLQGLLVGALVALATPTALLVGILLAPGIVALALNRSPGRSVARTMLLFGLAATVMPLVMLWKSGHTLDVATALVGDPRTVAMAWSAAAAGWLIGQVSPLVVRLALESAALARKQRLTAARNKCAVEWGLPDSGEPG